MKDVSLGEGARMCMEIMPESPWNSQYNQQLLGVKMQQKAQLDRFNGIHRSYIILQYLYEHVCTDIALNI